MKFERKILVPFLIVAVLSVGSFAIFGQELILPTSVRAAGYVDKQPPGNVEDLTATDKATGGAITLTWINPSDSDFSKVRIHRATTLRLFPQFGNRIAIIEGSRSSSGTYTDTDLTDNTKYYYIVRTEDRGNNVQGGLFLPRASAIPTSPAIVEVAPPTEETLDEETPEEVLEEITEEEKVDEHGELLQEGNLVRGLDEVKVYIINEHNYKRHIFNDEIFNMYEHLDREDIRTVSQEVLDSYTTSNLYKTNEDAKVFFIEETEDSAIKHHLKAAPSKFEVAGFHWNQIFIINQKELEYYVTGVGLIIR